MSTNDGRKVGTKINGVALILREYEMPSNDNYLNGADE